jgi:subtilisin family serine protease
MTSFTSGRYIVLMDGAPAAAYRGGVRGLDATAPAGSQTFDADSRDARRYAAHLRREQNAVADAVGAEPYYNYTASLNGFAAELTARQASALSRSAGVAAVVQDNIRQPDTVNSPRFLGLTGPLGLWRRVGGSNSTNGAGRGVVVGVIDSGINSQSPSFASTGTPRPASFTGTCDTGVAGDNGGFSCNDKLIGAHYYTAGQNDDIWEGEYLSPEDVDGHGSHTASTAAGNSGVRMTVDGRDFGLGSGMAPAARVAAYKVCWADDSDDGSAGCADSDSVAAIDQAVADGVDVINFSISGAVESSIDLVEVAFMYAADAGVFVATSAGNRGPDASTVAHPSPWVTTVAASTHTVNENTLVLENGQRFIGASITEGIGSTPMILSEDAPAAGVPVEDAALCLPGSLDSAEVTGKMVVCDRGVNARAEKSQTVRLAGGVAMVLVNVTEGSLNADLHSIPSIHLPHTDRPAIRTYVETDPTPTGAIEETNAGSTTPPPPTIATFSSRGPSLASDGDLLKPDIAAPGVDVLAAVAPEGNNGRDFDFISGTSMASPHIAGLAALIIQKHPQWSPMVVKSAMMTTAGNLSNSSDPFEMGAGHVKPRSFMDPGLAFDSDFDDWEDFLTGQGLPLTDNPVDASNFNTASVAVNHMAGSETVTREVTNVDNRASTYSFARSGLGGIRTSVKPSTFTLQPGQSQRVRITFTRGPLAALDTYSKGFLYFRDDRGHSVRFPAVVNPAGIEAPAEVVEERGTFVIRTKSGVDGTVAARRRGLVPGVETAGTATDTEAAGFDPDDPRNYRKDYTIGGPAQTLRLQLLGDFDPNDDMDLFLTNAADEVVASSATAVSDEAVTVSNLPAGVYTAHVQAWAVQEGTTKDFTLRSFHVKGAVNNWSVAPPSQEAQVGEPLNWTVTTSSLAADTPYLGRLTYVQLGTGDEPNQLLGSTLVSITP